MTTATFPSTLSETYTYDGVGNLLTKTDRKTQTITYTYDALNRLTLKKYPDQTTVAYTYDAATRLAQVVDPTGTYVFAFDGLGRLKQTTTTYSFLTGRNLSVSYTYDTASNRASMTDAEGGVTTYTDNVVNLLRSITDFQNHTYTSYYNDDNRLAQLTRDNGVNTTYSYDALLRLTAITHQKNGTQTAGASYVYDSAGNRTSRTDLQQNTTLAFGYDAIYELTTAMQGTSTKETYSYDAVGNRTSSLGVASYSYNTSNELTAQTGAGYTYDSNGNLLTKVAGSSTTMYAWDFENRLSSVTLPGTAGTVSFKYDPFGRRIEKVSSLGTSIYVYDGDNQIEEVNASGAAVARYTQGLGIDEPLGMLRGGVYSYYHGDGLGSIVSLSNTSGTYSQLYSYDSFGNLTSGNPTVTNPFQYTAREFDTETGLYYYRARYYDPSVGRFLVEDLLRSSDGFSQYTYVLNSPVNFIDPLGLCPWEIRTRPLHNLPRIKDISHLYFHNTQTKESIGLGPDGWERNENPSTNRDDRLFGPIPDDLCGCIDNRLKNPGSPPAYCGLGGARSKKTCYNCWTWGTSLVSDCAKQVRGSKGSGSR